MNDMNEILKALRKEKNYSQSIMAKLLNITQQAYANYENGTRNIPIDTLIKIADLYEVSLDYITGRNSEKLLVPTHETSEHLKQWNYLTERNKGKVDLLIEQLLEEQEKIKNAI